MAIIIKPPRKSNTYTNVDHSSRAFCTKDMNMNCMPHAFKIRDKNPRKKKRNPISTLNGFDILSRGIFNYKAKLKRLTDFVGIHRQLYIFAFRNKDLIS